MSQRLSNCIHLIGYLAQMPERSKGFDSSSNVFALVGSNPTLCKSFHFFVSASAPWYGERAWSGVEALGSESERCLHDRGSWS